MEKIIKEKFINTLDKDNTKKTYGNQIDSFFKFIEQDRKFENDEELLRNIGFDDVEAYHKYLLDKNNSKATINLKIRIISELFKYAKKRTIVSSDYTDVIKKYKRSDISAEKKNKYVPSFDEVEKLIKQTYVSRFGARREDYISHRDRFLIALLSTTGMRINEALGIEIDKEVEECDGFYMIRIPKEKDKGNVGKRVPIVKSIEPLFLEYLAVRDEENIKFNSNLLFFSKSGKILEGRIINRNLQVYADSIGADGHITNHSFRYFLTGFLRKKGEDLSMIYKILGWSERGIISTYDGDANAKKYDMEKLVKCDIFANA